MWGGGPEHAGLMGMFHGAALIETAHEQNPARTEVEGGFSRS